GAGVTTGAGSAFLAFFAPFCPVSWNGVSLPRVTDFANVAAAIDTDPDASPNCASIAEWLDGMSPYNHFVPVRGVIVHCGPSEPNSSTRLAAWNAPHTYRQSDRSTSDAARCSRIRV